MIRSIELIPADREGLLLELDKPEDTGIVVKSVDGLGPAKATINTTALSLTDSAMFNGSRVGMRTITLTLLPLAVPTVECSRHRIYNLLPIKQPVTIIVRTDTRTVKTLGYVESSEPDIFSSEEAVKATGRTELPTLRSICPSSRSTRLSSSTGRTPRSSRVLRSYSRRLSGCPPSSWRMAETFLRGSPS